MNTYVFKSKHQSCSYETDDEKLFRIKVLYDVFLNSLILCFVLRDDQLAVLEYMSPRLMN